MRFPCCHGLGLDLPRLKPGLVGLFIEYLASLNILANFICTKFIPLLPTNYKECQPVKDS